MIMKTKKSDNGTGSYSVTGILKIFPTLATSLGYVHRCSRGTVPR